ncbi:MAG TPA: response regulator [Verrucomicrobiae bacterium]|nr:response regulator [Verrucomicrobiae bacterium]
MKPDLILIADDNDDHVLLLRRALKRGALLNPTFVVHDGEEAVAYLKGEGKFADRYEYPLPSLLLLDLRMPKMDGFEVLEWIRQQPCLRRLRVVVLTTSDQPRDIDRAYELGANSFIIKPLEAQHFLKVADAIKGYWLWMSESPRLNEQPTAPLTSPEQTNALGRDRG